MKQKWIFTGAAFALAMTLTGCRDNAVASIPQPSSQEQTKDQTQMIPIEEAQEAALKAADIEAADADISATTLSEVAGVACYKVEFTSGEYAYAYTINAETGAVMEMSSQEQNAQASGTQTEAAAQAQTSAPTTAQTATGTGTVDEAAAQKIALEHAGVKAADATIIKSKLDYEDGHQVYDIEWYAGGAKYDYEIAADTGEIISSAYEEKTMGANSNNVTVSEADAKKTALDRVNGATDKDIYEWKLDYDDGRPEYEGKIIYGGMEYEFTIDAATGSIIEWDAETIR
ncbi:PepSY domain-containing protein [Suilimivivens sp.]|uniref:PepSY domain-containing protein n=1 Tax=Suilimivivens sp. TaxID=2981669 RepID=UPI0030779816